MTLQETFSPATEKGELAYIAIRAIEEHLRNHGYRLSFGADDGIHEALWDALGYVEVEEA